MLQFRPGLVRCAVPRRVFLAAGIAGVASCAFPRAAGAVAALSLPAATGNRRFSVFYQGDRIGSHTVSYSSASGEMRVATAIDLLVKVAFFDVFAFRHRSEESWRGGRLMSLTSDTVEDGEPLHVEGRETRHGFRVISDGGPFIASAATLTSNSLWTPAVLDQATVVDAQHGGVIGVSARTLGDELILVGGRSISATRHTFITPYLAGSIWYDKENLWVQGEFEREGSKVQYVLDS